MDYQSAYAGSAHYRAVLADLQTQIEDVRSCRNGDRLNHSIAYELITAWPGRGGILDIGAGNGFFLRLAAEAGYAPSGVEVSQAARAFIQAQVHSSRVFASLSESDGRFQAVTALEVLEHVEDPLGFLSTLRERLAPEGILILSVPNLDRPFWRYGARGLERAQWRANGLGDTAPHHLTRFTREGMERILHRAGFSAHHVGFTPTDAVHLMLHGVGATPSFVIRFLGVPIRIPFSFIKPYLTREVAFSMCEMDESLGFGIMAVAGGSEPAVASLSDLFREARRRAMDKYLRYLDQDLAAKIWSNRRHIVRNIGYWSRMLRGR